MIAVFLDRDGTLGGEGGGVHPLEFNFFYFSISAIRILNHLKIKVFLFTNQSWIGMGKITEETFLEGNRRMESKLNEQRAFLDGIYYCPHRPEDYCECRKPSPSLLLRAQEDFKLNLKKCYVVGDRLSDMESANHVGAKKILVLTGRGKKTLRDLHNKGYLEIDFIADHVLQAAEWIQKDLQCK